jgi:hypothetical protein
MVFVFLSNKVEDELNGNCEVPREFGELLIEELEMGEMACVSVLDVGSSVLKHVRSSSETPRYAQLEN